MPVQSHDLIGAGWAFPPIENTGRVELVRGDEEILQAIKIILGTPVGSRVMRPAFGSRLHELIFAPINVSTIAAARYYVEQALGYWEPRIEVNNVDAAPYPEQPEILLIKIDYTIRATHDERSLVVPFYTIPGEE